MNGMHAKTGEVLSGIDHVHQSVADILTTPIGSRVLLREYGSELFKLIDQPDNGVTRMRVFGAAATALMRWEPRIELSRLSLYMDGTRHELLIEGEYLDQQGTIHPFAVTVPLQPNQAAA